MKKLFNASKLVEQSEENFEVEGFPFKILFKNQEGEFPYFLQEVDKEQYFLKVIVDEIPPDVIEEGEERFYSKNRLLEWAIKEPLPLNMVNNYWKQSKKFIRDDRLLDSTITGIDLDETSKIIFIYLLLKPRTRKIYATHYDTIKSLFKNYLTFTIIKDLLDVVKEQVLPFQADPKYKEKILKVIENLFSEEDLALYLDNGYLKSTEILQTTLREFLVAYGQILTENYLRLYDTISEEEIPKIRSLNEMNFLPEEFMIQHLTRIYKTLSFYVKMNEKKKQLKLLRVLTGQGRLTQGEKEETVSIEIAIKNKLDKFKIFLVNTINKSKSFEGFLKAIDKNISVYTNYLKKDISYILSSKK